MNNDNENDSVSNTSESTPSIEQSIEPSIEPSMTTLQDEDDVIPDRKTLKLLRPAKHLPYLKGFEDFDDWKDSIFDELQMNEMYKFFTRAKTPPSDPDKANRWIKGNSWTRQLLLRSITPELVRLLELRRIPYAAEIYDLVKQHIMKEANNNLAEIQFKWDNLEWTDFHNTICRILELRRHLETLAKRQIAQAELVDKLIKVVPAKWQCLAVDARHCNPNIQFRDLVDRIKSHRDSEEQKKARERFKAQPRPKPPTKTQAKSYSLTEKESQPSDNEKAQLHCEKCKKNGHTEEKCFKKRQMLQV